MPGVDGSLTVDEVAACVSVAVADVERWIELGLIGSTGSRDLQLDDLERARLLVWASGRGIDAEAVAAVSAREGDVLAPFVAIAETPRAPGFSLAEAAHRAGIDEDLARRVWVARGISPDDELFDEDVTAMTGVRHALDAGLPEEALIQLARVLGDALGRVADAEVRLFHFYVHEPIREANPDPVAEREVTAAAIDALRALTEPSILYAHRKAFERAMRDDLFVHLAEDAAPPGATAQLRAAVLFVDLARYTPLTEAMGDAAVVTVLDRFSDVVREQAIRWDGRIVKQIGDEFMVVFFAPRAMLSCARGIADAVAAEPNFPALRMGAHVGPVLFREADYLGATVNVAARVAACAGANELLVTDAVLDAVDEPGLVHVELGPRPLKGLREPVTLHRVAITAREQPSRDPVCGMHVAATASIEHTHAGAELLFCSEGCREIFRASPERYVT